MTELPFQREARVRLESARPALEQLAVPGLPAGYLKGFLARQEAVVLELIRQKLEKDAAAAPAVQQAAAPSPTPTSEPRRLTAEEQDAKYAVGTRIEIAPGQPGLTKVDSGLFEITTHFSHQSNGNQYFQYVRLTSDGRKTNSRGGNLRGHRFNWLERHARVVPVSQQAPAPSVAAESPKAQAPDASTDVVGGAGLSITEELTTPRKAGKTPRPVWVVRGNTRENAALLKQAGGRYFAGAWSFFQDPTETLVAVLGGTPAASSSGPPPRTTGRPIPDGVFVPAVWRKILALNIAKAPILDLPRSVGSVKIAAEARALFKRLGLDGLRATKSSSSRYVDVHFPGYRAPLELERSFNGVLRDDGNHPLYQVSQVLGAVDRKVEALIAHSFPNQDNRSDYQTDYFDFVFSVSSEEPDHRLPGDTTLPLLDEERGSIEAPDAQTDAEADSAPVSLTVAERGRRAQKFRDLAATVQREIDQKSNSGLYNLNPTRRRSSILEGIEADRERLEQLRAKLLALADALEGRCEPSGAYPVANDDAADAVVALREQCLPRSLQGVDSRALVSDLLRGASFPAPHLRRNDLQDVLQATTDVRSTRLARPTVEYLARDCRDGSCIVTSAAQLRDLEILAKAAPKVSASGRISDELKQYRRAQRAGLDTAEKWQESIEDLRSLGQPATSPDNRARQIRKAERDLIGLKIPGFVPTPPTVVAQMVVRADLRPGQRVLEPEGGKGDIAEAIRQAGLDPDVIEINGSLRALLELKGFRLVASDFLTFRERMYDRVLMNPPFENLADIDHVRHAFDLLASGGRIVAIMGEGPFFRSDKKAQAFRQWLELYGGQSERLPPDAFRESDRPTGVQARIVVIDRTVPRTAQETEAGGRFAGLEVDDRRPPGDPGGSNEERAGRFAALEVE